MPPFISDKHHLALYIALGDLFPELEPFEVHTLLSNRESKVLVFGAFILSQFHELILSLGSGIIAW